jgi:uncharacterized alkaline shock family protein YloU
MREQAWEGGLPLGVIDRLLLFLCSIGLAVLALVVCLTGLQIGIQPELVRAGMERFYQDLGWRWVTAAVSLSVLLISLRLLLVSLSRKKRIDPGVEHKTEVGYIHISLSTIESIALKAARRVKGVRDLTARIRHQAQQGSVTIGLKITVDGETPIQPLSEQLQQLVKEQVKAITGVEVSQVSVYVAQTVQPDKTRICVE